MESGGSPAFFMRSVWNAGKYRMLTPLLKNAEIQKEVTGAAGHAASPI